MKASNQHHTPQSAERCVIAQMQTVVENFYFCACVRVDQQRRFLSASIVAKKLFHAWSSFKFVPAFGQERAERNS